MSLLTRLERRFGRFAVPHLTIVLIAGQVVAYVANMAPVPAAGGAQLVRNIGLDPALVASGEWWRVITSLFTPPLQMAIFAFFFWYFFYLMGTTLEATWGRFRYNVYLLIGYIASIVMTFVAWQFGGAVGQVATNGFLFGSVLLAFARLNPDFQLLLFFILPVRIYWVAVLTWVGYGITLLSSPSWLDKSLVIAAVLNYLLFFGRDIARSIKHGHRGMQFQAKRLQGRGAQGVLPIIHACRVCGLTSETSPRTQFRYCMKCDGGACYCAEHLDNHEHVGSGERAEVGGRGATDA